MTEYEIIGGDGKEYGPYPAEKIRELLLENRLKPYSKIRPTQGDWTTVEALPEFAQQLPNRPATRTTYRRHGCTLQSSTPHSWSPVPPAGPPNNHWPSREWSGDFHTSPRLLLWSYSDTGFSSPRWCLLSRRLLELFVPALPANKSVNLMAPQEAMAWRLPA